MIIPAWPREPEPSCRRSGRRNARAGERRWCGPPGRRLAESDFRIYPRGLPWVQSQLSPLGSRSSVRSPPAATRNARVPD